MPRCPYVGLPWHQTVREDDTMMKVWWGLSLFYPAFVVYQGYYIAVSPIPDSSDPSVQRETLAIFNLVCAGGSCLLTRAILLYYSTLVAGNFGKGLKEKVLSKRWAVIANLSTTSLIDAEHKATVNV